MPAKKKTPSVQPADIYTTREVADILGWDRQKVMYHRAKLKAITIGGRYRFDGPAVRRVAEVGNRKHDIG